MATIRTYQQATLFNLPAVPKQEKVKPEKKIIPEKERKLNRRKYNAAYRLRCKIGSIAFPQKSKNIFCELGNYEIENIQEIKILTNEFGFVVKPLAFSNI